MYFASTFTLSFVTLKLEGLDLISSTTCQLQIRNSLLRLFIFVVVLHLLVERQILTTHDS